jgi:hypothetical protein
MVAMTLTAIGIAWLVHKTMTRGERHAGGGGGMGKAMGGGFDL